MESKNIEWWKFVEGDDGIRSLTLLNDGVHLPENLEINLQVEESNDMESIDDCSIPFYNNEVESEGNHKITIKLTDDLFTRPTGGSLYLTDAPNDSPTGRIPFNLMNLQDTTSIDKVNNFDTVSESVGEQKCQANISEAKGERSNSEVEKEAQVSKDNDSTTKNEEATTETVSEPSTSSLSLEIYKFEIEKLEHAISILRRQLLRKDETIAELNEKVDEFEEWKQQLEANKDLSTSQYKDECDKLVKLKDDKINSQHAQIHNLTSKLQQMEALHSAKDDELRSLRGKLLERELQLEERDLEYKASLVDKNLLKDSIVDIERNYHQRELKLKLDLEMEYQKQLRPILEQEENDKHTIQKLERQIKSLNNLLNNSKLDYNKLLGGVLRFKDVLVKKNEEIEYYKSRLLSLESEMVLRDRSSELKISMDAQNKLKDRCKDLEIQLSRYEIAAKFQDRITVRSSPDVIDISFEDQPGAVYRYTGDISHNRLLNLPHVNIKRC